MSSRPHLSLSMRLIQSSWTMLAHPFLCCRRFVTLDLEESFMSFLGVGSIQGISTDFCKPEIYQNTFTRLEIPKKICWFHISMHDSPSVRIIQSTEQASKVFAYVWWIDVLVKQLRDIGSDSALHRVDLGNFHIPESHRCGDTASQQRSGPLNGMRLSAGLCFCNLCVGRFESSLESQRWPTVSLNLPKLLHDLQLIHDPIRTTRHINPFQCHVILLGSSIIFPCFILYVQIGCGAFRLFPKIGDIRIDI
jgi:hypothetical protein